MVAAVLLLWAGPFFSFVDGMVGGSMGSHEDIGGVLGLIISMDGLFTADCTTAMLSAW